MRWRILLCNDGSPESAGSEAALRCLGLLKDSEVVILGVVEAGHDEAAFRSALQALAGKLSADGVAASVRVRRGHAAEEILAEAEETYYDIVIVGARGRRGLTRFRLGSTASRLAEHLPTSLLACRGAGEPTSKVLICTSGEEPALETVRTAGEIAASAGADVLLLHVMSQVALSWESPADDLADTAETAITRGTPEGLHLRRGLEILREVGVVTQAVPRLRHGLVVDEVLDEVRESGTQLLAIGAHRVPETRRSIAPFLDDVAGQLLANAPCSVLIVRHKVA